MIGIFIHLIGLTPEIFKSILTFLLNYLHLDPLHLAFKLLPRQNIATHPRMAQYLRNGQSVSGVKCEHSIQQILELSRKLRLLLMRSPKLIDIVERDEFIEAIVGGGRKERRLGCHQIEESDSCRKQVIHHSVVILSHQQFWRFERVRTTESLGLAVIGNLSRKS